jgi:hypothetical protein
MANKGNLHAFVKIRIYEKEGGKRRDFPQRAMKQRNTELKLGTKSG